MTYIIIIAAILNFSCGNSNNTDQTQQDAGLLEETASKTAEVVNEAFEIEESDDANVTKSETDENLDESTANEEQKRSVKAQSVAKTQASVVESGSEIKEGEYKEEVKSEQKEEVITEKENKATSSDDQVKEVEESQPKADEKSNHKAFNDLLQAHVSSKGAVDYKGFQSSESKLDAYLDELRSATPDGSWSRDEQLAYWINAYNAFTIKLILDHYPVSSIQDIASGKPWDKKWIKLGDKTYSLNQIENDIIRPEFNEPRIHFAVNCAAKSCPPLANEAFTAENLNSLLEKRTKSFINNGQYNTISKNSVKVSKIFDWYGKDFGDKLAFLNKYSDTKIASGTKIEYSEYDWALNN